MHGIGTETDKMILLEFWNLPYIHMVDYIDEFSYIEPSLHPWNCTQSLHTYGHLIFDKEAKNIQWKNENIFNSMVLVYLDVYM